MTLDAYTAAIRRRMAAAYPDLGGAVIDAREARRRYAEMRYPAGPPVAAVEEHMVPGEPDVLVRVYVPRDAPPRAPLVVYFHGGGFVLCGLDTHDHVCRVLADGTPAVVVSVDYRLAPEHPFPAAPDDAYAVMRWASANAARFGADPGRLAVAGDSAGGALAAATCLRARDEAGPAIAFQLLIYPVTDCLAVRRDVPDSLLTPAHMSWFIEQYLARPEDGAHPYASPLRAPSLDGLPSAFVLTAGHDPLRAEGEAFADRLRQAGVPVRTHLADGMFHTLFGFGSLVPAAREAERLACAALRDGLPDPVRAG
ncbi:alpha/beta hydrolase [Actinoallomurus sp. NPDC050550]|uniref:alpha/beta hydrolase n=1 Tax=Actinoallomurus sp. NPDC050550 TaxID=3154937 RepID=UPI0033DC316B